MNGAIPFVALAFLPLLAGCATLVNGSSQRVWIDSNPSGAACTVDGGRPFQTPTSLDLARTDGHQITCVKQGFLPAYAHVGLKLSGWTLFNFPIIGQIVDFDSGGAFNLTPTGFMIELQPRVEPALPGFGEK